MRLTQRDKERYLRQMVIEGFGERGQEKLKEATVAVLGQGGLGSPATIYLAVAGVGRIMIVDEQRVELSNLNRQILHWEQDVHSGKYKTESAKWKLHELNSGVEVMERIGRVTDTSIDSMLAGADIVLDCTDNFETRYALNRFSVRTQTPFVHAAVDSLRGQMTTILPGKGPCLECLFPVKPRHADLIPVLGATSGVFGAMQAAEAVKLITGVGETLAGKLLVGDMASNCWEVIEVARREDCPCCH